MLSIPRDSDIVAHLAGVPTEHLEETIALGCQRLLAARQKRAPPARNDKIIVSWNGLMLGSFAEASLVLEDLHYRDIATRNAQFILRELRADGQLGQRATAYVCRRFACQLPVNAARDLAAQLRTAWQD